MDEVKSKNRFGIILALVGAGLLILGVLFFSGKLGGKNSTSTAEPEGMVVVWGTLPQVEFNQALQFIMARQSKIGISYTQVAPNELRPKLIEAIAADIAPDMVVTDISNFYSIKFYTQEIPYAIYPEAGFKQAFSGVTHDLLTQTGVLGIPIGIDPIMMFFNREILAQSGYATPPLTWNDVYLMAPDIIKIEKGQLIRQELLPFGQYKNVNNAWAIISTLFAQSRVPIVRTDPVIGKFVNLANSDIAGIEGAGQRVIEFYTQFSDPKSQFYTWNRSMLDSKKEFLEGRLAFLPSFASEAKDLRDRNPNLNFGVAQIPQLNTDAQYQATFANVYVAGMLKKSTNPTATNVVLFEMAGTDFQKAFSQILMMAPALSSLLMLPPETTYLPTVYRSALIAKSWYNDDMVKTEQAFSQMVESVISGKQNVQQAIYQAERILNNTNF
ncbi:MAG: carbohydrate ABC transporter substrate-binding protein [Candidatus Pacebacteria bacterium]|nr:carbohydrate ABC transporter substrate-binding protein [Candidatus Paceibacterota bacterium]